MNWFMHISLYFKLTLKLSMIKFNFCCIWKVLRLIFRDLLYMHRNSDDILSGFIRLFHRLAKIVF